LHGEGVPVGISAAIIDVETMLPCVGQAAIGIEIRADDERLSRICERLNHLDTFRAVTAERAFLQGMGGGCQSPVAAYAEIAGDKITMRAVSFREGPAKRTEGQRSVHEAAVLGEEIAAKLR
jgi:hydroxymethylbilane synthase